MIPVLKLAFQSLNRQRAVRSLAALRVALLAGVVTGLWMAEPRTRLVWVGHVAAMLAIVEAAVLIGWRLAQWPKHRMLELLLVSPLSSRTLAAAELVTGLLQLALVSLASLPVLLGAALAGKLDAGLIPLILGLGPLWGAALGMAMVWWTYEPPRIRRWLERAVLGSIVLFLVAGTLAGPRLRAWVAELPTVLAAPIEFALVGPLLYSPFGVFECLDRVDHSEASRRLLVSMTLAFAIALLAGWRAIVRLRDRFLEQHFAPAHDQGGRRRGAIGDAPLAWHAIRQVTRYSGAINLYFASGFVALYAGYIAVGPAAWPDWLGQEVMSVFDALGGVPAVVAGLALLAAVPAAYQYGLWDPSADERIKKLELLLLADLRPTDWLHAAFAASWHRGRHYLSLALVTMLAAWAGGRIALDQLLLGTLGAMALVSLTFAVGFLFLPRSTSTWAGMMLSLGMPLAAFTLGAGGPLGRWIPPGGLAAALTNPSSFLMTRSMDWNRGVVTAADRFPLTRLHDEWTVSLTAVAIAQLLAAALILLIARRTLIEQLRRFYTAHAG